MGLIADQSETPPNIAMLNGLLLAATQAVIDATGVQIVPRDFACRTTTTTHRRGLHLVVLRR